MTVRLKSAGAAAALALILAGCGTAAAPPRGYHFWLVKVKGNYATLYKYPPKDRPATTTPAVELGLSDQGLAAAASKLHIPRSHVTNEAGG